MGHWGRVRHPKSAGQGLLQRGGPCFNFWPFYLHTLDSDQEDKQLSGTARDMCPWGMGAWLACRDSAPERALGNAAQMPTPELRRSNLAFLAEAAH